VPSERLIRRIISDMYERDSERMSWIRYTDVLADRSKPTTRPGTTVRRKTSTGTPSSGSTKPGLVIDVPTSVGEVAGKAVSGVVGGIVEGTVGAVGRSRERKQRIATERAREELYRAELEAVIENRKRKARPGPPVEDALRPMKNCGSYKLDSGTVKWYLDGDRCIGYLADGVLTAAEITRGEYIRQWRISWWLSNSEGSDVVAPAPGQVLTWAITSAASIAKLAGVLPAAVDGLIAQYLDGGLSEAQILRSLTQLVDEVSREFFEPGSTPVGRIIEIFTPSPERPIPSDIVTGRIMPERVRPRLLPYDEDYFPPKGTPVLRSDGQYYPYAQMPAGPVAPWRPADNMPRFTPDRDAPYHADINIEYDYRDAMFMTFPQLPDGADSYALLDGDDGEKILVPMSEEDGHPLINEAGDGVAFVYDEDTMAFLDALESWMDEVELEALYEFKEAVRHDDSPTVPPVEPVIDAQVPELSEPRPELKEPKNVLIDEPAPDFEQELIDNLMAEEEELSEDDLHPQNYIGRVTQEMVDLGMFPHGRVGDYILWPPREGDPLWNDYNDVRAAAGLSAPDVSYDEVEFVARSYAPRNPMPDVGGASCGGCDRGSRDFFTDSSLGSGQLYASSNLRVALAPLGEGEHGMITLGRFPYEVTINSNQVRGRAELALAHEVVHFLEQMVKLEMTHEQVHHAAWLLLSEGYPAMRSLIGQR